MCKIEGMKAQFDVSNSKSFKNMLCVQVVHVLGVSASTLFVLCFLSMESASQPDLDWVSTLPGPSLFS